MNKIPNIAEMNAETEYKNSLINFDLQTFLKEHEGSSALQLKKKYPALYRILASQLRLYSRASKKLPGMTGAFCYFTSKSYEQSSSEALARYKASLFSGNTMIDLSAGLGVDDIAFSGSFRNIISIDPDRELNLLAEINFRKLFIGNITRISDTAENYIKNEVSADLVYIDADRRSTLQGKKTITLHNSSPDILKMLNRLFEISPKVLLKLSPMADITYLQKTLPFIKEIRVASLDGEVKEILVLMEHNFSSKPVVYAIEIPASGVPMQFPRGHSVNYKETNGSKYFFEPAPCLTKAGLAGKYADFLRIEPLDSKSVLMQSTALPDNFMGRVFQLVCSIPFSKSEFRKYLQNANISKANVNCRNFPVKPDEVRKMFKLKDGGEDYFFLTLVDGKKYMFHCRKLGTK
jgi:hypothetical protein